MGVVTVGRERCQFDIEVDVPYGKTALGYVTFYLKWVPVMRATESAPQEGGHWETVHIYGPYADDDGPDLEDAACVLADEKVEKYGLNFNRKGGRK